MSTPLRSIAYVFPIFNEEENIELLHATMVETVAPLVEKYRFEFIFIDDGSRDDSLRRLMELRERDSRVSVIALSRNFGHQMAVTAGLDHSDADAVIIMDADLQDPPAVSLELIERWEAGADVVYAQRRSRQDGVFKRASAHAFYWTLSRLASIEIPRNTGDFRLLDRKVVEEVGKYRERNRFLRGLVSHVGFRQEAVAFDRHARHAGETGYPLRKMVRFAADGILGFSTVPLQLISRIGMLMSVLAFVGIVYVVFGRLFTPENVVPGWAFVTVSMFFLGGIQLTMLGVLGSYIGRIYVEAQARPLYGVKLYEHGH